ncbi:MAG: type II/IV secretion system protein [Kiritimatiellales bacterium]|nr:type II/IV secretion system protein [Kiritimatiellota bacterium]MBL7015925.1 type II/IV secretion system protein [Kiritimatiellales bacterium]
MSAAKNLTAEQLQKVFFDHQEKDVSMKHIAEDCGLSSSRELAAALSDLLQIPLIEIPEEFHIERDVLEQVPEVISRRYTLIPFEQKDKHSLTLVMANPLDLDALDTVRFQTKLEVHRAVGVEEEILALINKSYKQEAYIEEGLQDIVSLENMGVDMDLDEPLRVELDQLKDLANDMPVIRFVNLLLMGAIRDRASDIHFEPAEKSISIRFRVDGVLREVTPPPRTLYAAITTRLKILSELDIAEHRLPQDGLFKFKVHGRVIDVRVSVLPVAHGEKVVLRILDRDSLLVDMADVGFDPPMLKDFKQILENPNGIILLTGPTGSGKTTTLYSALSHLKCPERNIQTVEDPIEYLIDGVNQTAIRPQIGLDFASCLRSILRQDPDIIMIGEIRDLETAQIATRSSLTGHLVLSTLHTNDAPSSFSRLRDIGVPSYLISATVRLVIAQRLVRLICPRCKTQFTPSSEKLELISRICPDAAKWSFFHGAGCIDCQQTGFLGRSGIFEFMRVSDHIRGLISKDRNSTELRNEAIASGMESLAFNGLMKVKQGLTTIDEVLHVTQQL